MFPESYEQAYKPLHSCDHPGCRDQDATPCILTILRGDIYLWQAARLYGFRVAWELWRHGVAEVLYGYYCADHAWDEGFCWGCGRFTAGCSSAGFDILHNGQWLCDDCWGDYLADCDDPLDTEDWEFGSWWDDLGSADDEEVHFAQNEG